MKKRIVVFLMALPATGAYGQELVEVCPEGPAGTGAVWGVATDADSGIGLPGATVVATWDGDGETVRTEVRTALDGGYVLCGVPRGTEVSVRPVLAGAEGTLAVTILTDDFARADLRLSLTGDGDDDDRLWACLDSRVDPNGNIERLRLFRCDSDWSELDACPREELGEVEAVLASASRTMVVRASEVGSIRRGSQTGGSVSALREAIGELVTEARRLRANALVDWRMRGGARERRLTAKAVTITADPSSCK